jgi:hypothetical protein
MALRAELAQLPTANGKWPTANCKPPRPLVLSSGLMHHSPADTDWVSLAGVRRGPATAGEDGGKAAPWNLIKWLALMNCG